MSADALPQGRVLFLVSHPDDEAIGCGALLQRVREPLVVFATDGAPEDPYFWRKHGSRDAYREVRRREVAQALVELGVTHYRWLADEQGACFQDQTLFQRLPEAHAALRRVLAEFEPDAIVTQAYEGGHPDHDTCGFLAAAAAGTIPAWEFPLYHRGPDGRGEPQAFLDGDAGIVLVPTPAELERKLRAWAAYASQGDFLGTFDPRLERFRRQAAYDFHQPPHPGQRNFEHWEWSMTSEDVAAAFSRFARSRR